MTSLHASLLVLIVAFMLAQLTSLSLLWLIAAMLFPIH